MSASCWPAQHSSESVDCHVGASDSTLTEAARAEIMCYNEDRSMTGFVSPTANGQCTCCVLVYTRHNSINRKHSFISGMHRASSA